MKITRLAIKNYRGLRDLSVEVPPGGAIIGGGNARGKTSILKAIGAALGAQGIGADAIHVGETQAEILIDLDALKVRRSISAKGTSLTVKTTDGDNKAKPQTYLTELFGAAPLDPLAFFLADPKERRRQILEAMPLKITAQDVERWTGFVPDSDVATAYDGHGLEELERLRKTYYSWRADANKTAKETAAKAKTAAEEAARQASALDGAPDKAQAESELNAVVSELNEIKGRAAAAERAHRASAATREKIEKLRATARDLRSDAGLVPTPDEIAEAETKRATAEAKCLNLRLELAAAELEERRAIAICDGFTDRLNTFNECCEKAAGFEEQADSLEASLASVGALVATPDQIAAVEKAVQAAKENVVRAHAAGLADLARLAAEEAEGEAKEKAADAAAYDKIVDTLTNVAPRELAGRADLIPGLALTEAGITLDGVSIDNLSGAEQMQFAIDLARRANAKAKILVVDGLERLDKKAMEEFVQFATRDGFQLLGTRVSEGDLVLEAIEPDEGGNP
jgi:DNA repair exonuclease SbcCD ATPase subunit